MLVNVDTPISTVSISLPKISLTTIFAPDPSVPVESKVSVSDTLYPSPLEKIVTDVIPAPVSYTHLTLPTKRIV